MMITLKEHGFGFTHHGISYQFSVFVALDPQMLCFNTYDTIYI